MKKEQRSSLSCPGYSMPHPIPNPLFTHAGDKIKVSKHSALDEMQTDCPGR